MLSQRFSLDLLGLDRDLWDEVAVVEVVPWFFPVLASFALGWAPLNVVTLHQLTERGNGEQNFVVGVCMDPSFSDLFPLVLHCCLPTRLKWEHIQRQSAWYEEIPVVAFPLLPLSVPLLPISSSPHGKVGWLVAGTRRGCTHRLVLRFSLYAAPRTEKGFVSTSQKGLWSV